MNKRIPKKLILGENYIVKFIHGKEMMCKFIQPTEKGFNFLNLNTSKCMLRHHLYPSKCSNHINNDETWFFVNEQIKIWN